MPAQKRIKTIYPGVYYIEGKAVGTKKPEKIFYIMYRKDGKQIHEKAGRQFQDDMTAARAAQLRTRKITGDEPTNKERRHKIRIDGSTEEEIWTIDKLFNQYIKGRKPGKSLDTDIGRYNNYIKPHFKKLRPHQIEPLEVDRLSHKLLKTKSPQTTKHVLNLLTWIVNFGVKKNLCEKIPFHIEKPTVNNQSTEDLTPEQLSKLLQAIEESDNEQIKNLMKMALYTGMRRGELIKLQWDDLKFDRSFILIRDPKGGPDQKIPLNNSARKVLDSHPRGDSPYVFPGKYGGQRANVQAGVSKIKKAAGLPKDFRPLHGLRHVYASILASSGQVDMYTLQKLLTHKDPRMTQRYAHLRDDALKKASDLAGDIIDQAALPLTNGMKNAE